MTDEGLLRYEIEFPVGWQYGAFVATIAGDGALHVELFSTEKEYLDARGLSGPDSLDGYEKTDKVVAPEVSSPGNPFAELLGLHHARRVEATALVEDVIYVDMNKVESKETYTHDGSNVVAADGWGRAWCLSDTGWHILDGPL